MDKLPSMKDIALRAGVSKTTVSLALRNDPQISAERKEEIFRIAKSLGYVRNSKLGEIMARMRGGNNQTNHGNIALINCNQDPKAFHAHPTIPAYVQGAKRRAASLGFSTDTFWLYTPRLTAKRWINILESRGIVGIVLIGMMKQNRLPDFFIPVVEKFPVVVTGVRTRKPALSFACSDHHVLAFRAVERAIELGYRRPGLVLDRVIDQLVQYRFTAGFRSAQEQYLAPKQTLEPFFDIEEAKEDSSLFANWFYEQKPDVIFTLYNSVAHWLSAMNVSVPQDVGLIQLEWRENRPHWAGMHQHNDIVGEAAVDLVINAVYNDERGVPAYPRATLIGASWKDGETAENVFPREEPLQLPPQDNRGLFETPVAKPRKKRSTIAAAG